MVSWIYVSISSDKSICIKRYSIRTGFLKEKRKQFENINIKPYFFQLTWKSKSFAGQHSTGRISLVYEPNGSIDWEFKIFRVERWECISSENVVRTYKPIYIYIYNQNRKKKRDREIKWRRRKGINKNKNNHGVLGWLLGKLFESQYLF